MSRRRIATTGGILAITTLALASLPAVATLALTPPTTVTTPRTAGTAPSHKTRLSSAACAPTPRPTVNTSPTTCPAPAPTADPSVTAPPPPPDPSILSNLPPGLIEALQRDLGLTRKQVATRLLNEARLTPVEAQLREKLGDRFGGSWFTGTLAETLMIATTSPADIPAIASAGATPKVVRASLATLSAVKGRLDDVLSAHPNDGTIRYVDVRINKVVVLSRNAPATLNVVKSIGVDSDLVVVVHSEEDPRPHPQSGDAHHVGAGPRTLQPIREILHSSRLTPVTAVPGTVSSSVGRCRAGQPAKRRKRPTTV
ncbi:S1 family peptidase [Streptosporangium sp. NPDC049304]|uniref:S1 family peptidase n=1 Tax=Streptosporangium sp. NPDC049304 TaxID=3154830 RepID=UPI0034237008